jgi:hypothetical protein
MTSAAAKHPLACVIEQYAQKAPTATTCRTTNQAAAVTIAALSATAILQQRRRRARDSGRVSTTIVSVSNT